MVQYLTLTYLVLQTSSVLQHLLLYRKNCPSIYDEKSTLQNMKFN